MTKSSENRKIKQKDDEFRKIAESFNGFFAEVFKQFFKQVKVSMDFMMYSQKPRDKRDRTAHAFLWWFWVSMIFFAIRGFCYTVFGR